MKLFMCSNIFTDKQREQTLFCLEVLENTCGHECALSADESRQLFGSDNHATFTAGESDLIVSLGGDGSVLRAARIAVSSGKSLIGINSGRLGYLCALSLDEVERFNEILSVCTLSRRSLLVLTKGDQREIAINDIVIAKKSFGETVDLSISIDGGEVIKVRGDGLIIATPTGSTAYNFSSRGPVLDPEMPAYVLTPICPHGTFDHSIVLNDQRVISATERNGSAQIYADGHPIGSLSEKITISKSADTLSLYSTSAVATGFLKIT